MSRSIRPFRDDDLPRLVEIRNRNFPDEPRTIEQVAYGDSIWDASRYDRVRLVAERDGAIVGWGEVAHMPYRFHPRKYALRLDVDPAHQRQGVGSGLHDELIATLQARGAHRVRARAQESRPASTDFLLHRGYREIQRHWTSHLDVNRFDDAPFATAEPRVARQGVTI